MKILKRHGFIAIFIAAASLGFARERVPGFYISGLVSADFTERISDFEAKQKDGRSAALALGYYTSSPIRLEVEFGAHTFDNSRYFAPNILTLPGYRGEDNGKSKHLSLMANVIYDFPINDRWDFSLGAGVGVMRFSGNLSYQYVITQPHIEVFPLPLPKYSGVDRLAAQAMAGLTFHLTPRFAVSAGYRLAAAENASFRGGPINTGTFRSVELGVRFRL